MGSIVMHLCVANEANKILKLDSNRFMVGSIAPDIHKISGGSREESHYIEIIKENGREYQLPNLEKFVEENREKIKTDPFIAGYYAHLIADKIWYRDVSCKYSDMKPEDPTTITLIDREEAIPYEEFRKQIYNDYTTINEFLLEKYNVETNYLYNIAVLNIEKQAFQKMLEENLQTKGYEVDEEVQLSILKLEDILDWIEKAKDETVKRLKEIL